MPTSPTRGRGRPPIGVRLGDPLVPEQMRADVETWAAERGLTRSAAVRQLIVRGLACTEQPTMH